MDNQEIMFERDRYMAKRMDEIKRNNSGVIQHDIVLDP